ncbi:LOW QUALITY PROTEIN: uncharacterized protein EMH_0010070 [Eimeria mitis]|uniref:Exportin-T n=1 Tax=Eimeria mitis TaxID=44415 RepID=U6K1W5_9EIME|nr:LOW QUALITY PROTEIN: uncharacterized protein EMH_0010070 [Eimeria mitis]CDJ31735.1 hypothetical protein, conserved [Eimeria mitis]
MQLEDFDRAVSALFSQGSAAVNPATRCEAEQYLRAVCDSSSGTTVLLSALQSCCSFEAKFFALQQLLQLLPPQQQQQRDQAKDLLFNVMRLRVCSMWACSGSSSSSSGEAENPPAQLAAVASDPGSSPDAAGVHNKLALLVARLLAADIDSGAGASGTSAAAAGKKAVFLPLRRLLHQEVCALCVQLQETEDGLAAATAAAAITDRCSACRSPSCAAAAGRNLAATLESIRVALRVLLVIHQEYMEDLPASTLCCSVAERYVGWIDLLLPPPPAAGAAAEARSSGSSNSSPNMLQLLGATWLSTGFSDAASAIVVFIHRKMEPAARIDLLCRMELIEWLLHEIPLTEVAASPSMIVPFAAIVNATVAALTEATASLAEKLEAAGGSQVSGPVVVGSSSAPVADRNPRELLQQGLTALWAVLPLSVQLLGSGGLEVSSSVVPSLSLLLSRTAVLQRQDNALLQPLSTTRLQGFLMELLQVLLKRLAEVDMLMGAAEQQQEQQQQQQVVYSSLDDEELEQLCSYKEALTGLFRKACAADQSRVLQWIQEGIQQHLQHLQHLQQQQQQQGLQQRREQQQQLAALLHMLLIMTDDITAAALHACMRGLLVWDSSRELYEGSCAHSAAAWQAGAAAAHPRGAFASGRTSWSLQQQHHNRAQAEALSLLAGPHGVCSSSTTIAPKACLALLRFVKNCLPYSAAYTGLLLQHLLQQQCLDIPRNSSSNGDFRQQRARPAVSPSCGNSSRQEPLALAAAADVYVLPRAFQVEQQLLLFEAAGVLLGCRQQLQGRTANAAQEHVVLLHALLAKATAAFTTQIPSGGDAASAVAVYCSRCANALASLSKGFQPFKQPVPPPASGGAIGGALCSSETEAEASVLGEYKKSWLQALQLFTDAVRVAGAEGSPLEVGGTSLVLLPPFLHASVFLLRRLLSLLGPLAASSIGALLPLLYDAVLVEADGAAQAAAASSSLQQQQHSPELAAELLSGFFMQLFVSLKGPPLLFLLLQHFPLVLERHVGLYLKAVAASSQEPNSAELQRECRGMQEQLACVLATAAREAPEALLRFAAASLLHAGSSSNTGDRRRFCVSLLLRCFTLAAVATPGTAAAAAVLPYSLMRSRNASKGTVLQAPTAASSPAAASPAAQAWAHLVAAFVCKPDSCVETEQQLKQQQQQELQQVAQLPVELQQVQEAMRDFTRQNVALETQLRQRPSQGGSAQTLQQPLHQSEEMQLLRQQQQQRVQCSNHCIRPQFVSFFNPLRSGLQEALKGGLAARIGDSCTAATAVAALVEALGQTDGQQLREVMRTWRRQFMPK